MHDSGLLGQMIPEFKAINCRVVRDFYHKYTVDEHTLLTIRNLERLTDAARPERERFARLLGRARSARAAGPGAALSRRRQVDSDDRSRDRERRAWRASMFDRLDLERGVARLRASSWSASTSRCRSSRSGATPRIPEIVRQFAGPGRRRRAAEDAVPADPGRRRGGQPRNADAVERRAALAALRRHLQPPHAGLRRRGHRPRRNRRTPSSSTSGRRTVSAEEIADVPRGLPRRYLQLFSRDGGLLSTSACRATSRPDSVTGLARAQATPAGSSPCSPTTSRSCSRTSRACCRSFGMDILRGFAFTKPTG